MKRYLRPEIVFGLVLLVELEVYLPFFATNPNALPPYLSVAGASFVTFQLFLVLFALSAGVAVFLQSPSDLAAAVYGALIFLGVMLFAGNVFFCWVWVIVGSVTFGLLHLISGTGTAGGRAAERAYR